MDFIQRKPNENFSSDTCRFAVGEVSLLFDVTALLSVFARKYVVSTR